MNNFEKFQYNFQHTHLTILATSKPKKNFHKFPYKEVQLI